MTWQSFLAWLRGDTPLYVPRWTPRVAQKHERETLRMLGRGDHHYAWSAKVRAQSQLRKPVLRMPKRSA